MQNKVSAANASAAPPVVVSIAAREITVPDMSARNRLAQVEVAKFRGYAGVIDGDETQAIVHGDTLLVSQQLKTLEDELESIVGPLRKSRGDILKSMQRVENLFAPAITYLTQAKTAGKEELLRWKNFKANERLRLQAEAEAEALAERQRLEKAAQEASEKAAADDILQRQLAASLELSGKHDEAAQVRDQATANLELAANTVEQTLEEAEHLQPQLIPSTDVKLAGAAFTGKWGYEITDIKEIFAGIVDGETSWDAVRVKVNKQTRAVHPYLPQGPDLKPLRPLTEIEAIEINLPWFADQSRQHGENFHIRGAKPVYKQGVRISS